MLIDFSYRCVFSFILPFFIWVCFGNLYIKFLKKNHANNSTVRKYVPESHLKKIGTPTMGGVLIIFSVLLSCFLFGDISNKYLLLLLYLMISYFMIGFCDDFFKVYINNTAGLSAKLKFFLEIVISCIFLYFLKNIQGDSFSILSFQPLFNFSINIGWVYIIFAVLVISGTSNAVNLTDGLDGLVSVPAIITYVFFVVSTYITSDELLFKNFSLRYIADSREIIILITSFIGSILGFFIFNKKPARIFMGDTGSLPIGAVLGGLALILKQEIILFFIGIIFVIEASSVIIQVIYFKITGKRFFLMAPIHHHFEKLGYTENNIVKSIWIISLIANLLLFTLLLK